MRRAVVFGGAGAIGSAIAGALEADGDTVVRTSRTARDGAVAYDPFDPARSAPEGPFDAAVWAQGMNAADSVLDFDLARFEAVQRANVTWVAASLADLLARDALRDGARLVVLSSIWQVQARGAKLAYTVSKAALAGLVHACAVDLAPRGMLVNAVLPSVTDTPMTRAMLAPEQIAAFEDTTGHGRLVGLDDVAQTVAHLAGERNGGVSGQSVAVDLGYTVGRRV